jgi:hypothetical protein
MAAILLGVLGIEIDCLAAFAFEAVGRKVVNDAATGAKLTYFKIALLFIKVRF